MNVYFSTMVKTRFLCRTFSRKMRKSVETDKHNTVLSSRGKDGLWCSLSSVLGVVQYGLFSGCKISSLEIADFHQC
jgi:hypothetical protein